MAHAPKDIDLPGAEKRPNGLLLDVARPIPTSELTVDGTERWALTGVTWVPWGCDGIQVAGVDCEAADDKDLNDYPEITDHLPFLMVDGIQCSTLSSLPEFMDARLAHNLDVQASSAFAYELMTASNSGGVSLASEATVLDPSSSLGVAIARLEDFLAYTLHGGRGVIHLTPALLTLAAAAGYVYQVGDVWQTATGHQIIADAGYVGAGGIGGVPPEDEDPVTSPSAWIYASGPVWYAISETKGVGERNQESTDMTRNVHQLLGERYGLVVFDPCSVAATLVESIDSGGGTGGGGDASAENQTEMIEQLNTLLTNLGDADVNLEALETLMTTLNSTQADVQDALTADAATLSNVADQDTNIQLLASNSARRGVIIVNESPGPLYIKYGATASLTDYTVQIPPTTSSVHGYWEMPGPIYTGRIDGIWTSSASGSARITELT